MIFHRLSAMFASAGGVAATCCHRGLNGPKDFNTEITERLCASHPESGKQSEAAEIIFRPACLEFDYASERARAKRVSRVMKREGDAASIGMDVVTVAAFLTLEGVAVGLQRGDKLARSEGTEAGKVNAHTVTATTGWSETVTLGGRESPSAKSSSITIWATSWMFLSASSLVWPQVAAPFDSSSGT
jgi:hypothetical protein